MDESEWTIGEPEPEREPGDLEIEAEQWLPSELKDTPTGPADVHKSPDWAPPSPTQTPFDAKHSIPEPTHSESAVADSMAQSPPPLKHAPASPPDPAADGDVTELLRRAKATTQRLAEIEQSTRRIMDRMMALASRVDDGPSPVTILPLPDVHIRSGAEIPSRPSVCAIVRLTS